MCLFTVLVRECFFVGALVGFKFPVKTLRDIFTITKHYGGKEVLHCLNLHTGEKGDINSVGLWWVWDENLHSGLIINIYC